jgi:hypothetical protein
VSFQLVQFDEFQGGDVGGFQKDRRSNTDFHGFPPAGHTQTPAISGFQPGKPVRWNGRRQIVAPGLGELKELLRHLGANEMKPGIPRSRVAAAIAVKTRDRL